jgi:hypothetical protein
MILKGQMEWEGMVLRVDVDILMVVVAEEEVRLEGISIKLRECYLADLMAVAGEEELDTMFNRHREC